MDLRRKSFALAGMRSERSGDSTAAMPKARFGEREFAAADIDEHKDSWPSPLQCHGCTVRVSAVRGYDKGETRVPAHFRRPGPKKHDPGCRYDTHAQGTQIADESSGLLVRERKEWRLVAEKVLKQPKPRLQDPKTQRPDVTFARQTTELLNTAAKVAHLIEQFRIDGGDISAGFAAVCDGRRISWNEFHYLPRSVWRLVRRLHPAGGPLARPVTTSHPVAIAMQVRTAHPSAKSTSFALEQPAPGSWLDPADPGYNLALRSKNQPLLKPYRPGTWVLALGLWQLWERSTARLPLEMCLWVDSPHQLVEIPPPPTRTTTRYQP